MNDERYRIGARHEGPSDATTGPMFCVPPHLERTIPQMRLLIEALSVEGRGIAAKAVSDALSAIEWMAEQITRAVDLEEARRAAGEVYDRKVAARKSEGDGEWP